jgi:hypothetical protein
MPTQQTSPDLHVAAPHLIIAVPELPLEPELVPELPLEPPEELAWPEEPAGSSEAQA